jgi:hypothetical protein
MKKLLLCVAGAALLAGCSGVLEKQQPVCSGIALVGGQENTVQIYGVRKQKQPDAVPCGPSIRLALGK